MLGTLSRREVGLDSVQVFIERTSKWTNIVVYGRSKCRIHKWRFTKWQGRACDSKETESGMRVVWVHKTKLRRCNQFNTSESMGRKVRGEAEGVTIFGQPRYGGKVVVAKSSGVLRVMGR